VPLDGQDIAQTIAVPVAEMDRLAVALQVVDLAVRFPVGEVLGVFEQLDFTARPDPDVVVVTAAVHVAVPGTVAFESHAALETLLLETSGLVAHCRWLDCDIPHLAYVLEYIHGMMEERRRLIRCLGVMDVIIPSCSKDPSKLYVVTAEV
jgi:hypothetical protein